MTIPASYYSGHDNGFRLFEQPGRPQWRPPQLAALGAILAHWGLGEPEPPLISLPTGVGKTAIGVATPHLARCERVLVVVPSTELRDQTAARFADQATLRQIGAIAGGRNPRVRRVSSRVKDWEALRHCDVVVALPNSISPQHYEEANRPPRDLFDLIVVDEAHHAPAPTWNAILQHFAAARALLLTATPRRRDRKRVPGKLAFYYPLKKALSEGLYQPVDAIVLESPGAAKETHDLAITHRVAALMAEKEHATSQILVRAASIDRATSLAEAYQRVGIEVALLHSRMSRATQQETIARLRGGTLRGVAIVGMLIEGFDLPSLRVAAYHDKHKSLEATAQLIGRLARVDAAYPQRSAVVTVNDADVYPQLQGAVRLLYEEDQDWAKVLPGIIDAEIREAQENVDYARSFHSLASAIDPATLHPLRRAILFEVEEGWEPPFVSGVVPAGLSVGAKMEGQKVLYSAVSPELDSIVVVTGSVNRPRWSDGNALDSVTYELHVVTFRRSTHTERAHLLLINTSGKGFVRALVNGLGASESLHPADTEGLQRAFDSLERLSVSSVGVRNTYAARGIPTYRMFAGSGIEGGLRHSDAGHGALGHAMVQVSAETEGEGAFTAGVSTGKAKWWETRYTPLRAYAKFASDLAERYWYPQTPPTGPLLPQISRGRRLTEWPGSPPVAAEMDPALVGSEWDIAGVGSLDRLELHVGSSPGPSHRTAAVDGQGLTIWATYPSEAVATIVWEGVLRLDGVFEPVGADRHVRRGFSQPHVLSALLEEHPPTVHFLDGTSLIGTTLHAASAVPTVAINDLLETIDWAGVNICAETRRRAAAKGAGISIHERLEQHLMSRPARGDHRWILCNDGPGEIADYICLELSRDTVFLDLWHAKAACGNAPGARVGDLQEVVAQAIKSRRWMTDRRLWHELAARLAGDETPVAVLVEGNRRQLEIMLGVTRHGRRLSLVRRSPQVTGEVGIAQPGLGRGNLAEALAADDVAALQIQQLLTVWQDCLNPVARSARVVCSE